jgi:hypothetical protein
MLATVAGWCVLGLIPERATAVLGAPIGEPLDLGNGVLLSPIPVSHLEAATARLELTWRQIWFMSGQPRLVVMRNFDADTPEELQPDRHDDPAPVTRRSHNRDLLILANLAIWLACPEYALWYTRTFHVERNKEGWAIHGWGYPRPLQAFRAGDGFLLIDDLARAREVNEGLAALDRAGPLWMAVRSLWGALTEPWIHGRYMLLWVALEALFGPRNHRLVRRSVSWRLASFLGQPELFEVALADYVRRSDVAHGAGQAIAREEWMPLAHRAEDWARAAVLRLLQVPALVHIFGDVARRERWLRETAGEPPAVHGNEARRDG